MLALSEVFGDWLVATSPATIGKRVAENFVSRRLGCETNSEQPSVHYAEACTWYGSLTFARLTQDEDLTRRLVQKFDPLLTPKGARYIPQRPHVDDRVFGIAPLEIFIQTKDERHLELGKTLADLQWESPSADGITGEARDWIDDMYMITVLQIQAFRATSNAVYLRRAARTMAVYLDRLQQPNGLFYHTPESPMFWSRGNGWVASGMTELLRSLPPDHPDQTRVLEGYRRMLACLLEHQGADGLWRQLIDKPEAWPETSGTAMFTFAMATGVKQGWLDASTYGPAARKAWLGLTAYLDDRANLRDVCTGTNQAFAVVGGDPSDQLKYYLSCPRCVGDLHGQAPVLWTASALLA
jgi:unsaturated rhamnogalacturonyl hydrolase